jgi:hypothetical protein
MMGESPGPADLRQFVLQSGGELVLALTNASNSYMFKMSESDMRA